MKPDNADEFTKRETFGRRRGGQLIKSVNPGDARTQFAMRVIWFILGAACATLACVLFTILLK